MKTNIFASILAALSTLAQAAPPTETITINPATGAVLNNSWADFGVGKLKVGGATISSTPSWASITNRPTTLAGYGITDPVVLSINGTAGDILVTDGTGSSGSSGSVTLTLSATGLTPGTYERITFDAKGRATAAAELPWLVAEGSGGGIITIPIGIGTSINYWTKVAGTGEITDGTRWKPGRAGWYLVQVFVGGGVPNDQVQLYILKNGTQVYYSQSSMWYRGVGGFVAVDVDENDCLEIFGAIWAGGAWGAIGNAENARWIVRWLGSK